MHLPTMKHRLVLEYEVNYLILRGFQFVTDGTNAHSERFSITLQARTAAAAALGKVKG